MVQYLQSKGFEDRMAFHTGLVYKVEVVDICHNNKSNCMDPLNQAYWDWEILEHKKIESCQVWQLNLVPGFTWAIPPQQNQFVELRLAIGFYLWHWCNVQDMIFAHKSIKTLRFMVKSPINASIDNNATKFLGT